MNGEVIAWLDRIARAWTGFEGNVLVKIEW